jgi:hypothetical protein
VHEVAGSTDLAQWVALDELEQWPVVDLVRTALTFVTR